MLHYVAWRERGFWAGGKLLARSQIVRLLSVLNQKHETFTSIQSYTPEAEIIGCPVLFADFDHKFDLELTRRDVNNFVTATVHHLNVVPLIYFSGNKGFHVVVPHTVTHPRCHEIVKAVVARISPPLPTLDPAVYRTRSMWRTVGSPSSQPGRYKTQITREELLHLPIHEIKHLAENPTPRPLTEYDAEKLDMERLDELVGQAQNSLPTRRELPPGNARHAPMTPCLTTLFLEGAPEGLRNRSVFLLAKHFKLSGTTLIAAEHLMLGQPHFANWEVTGTTRVLNVLRSVYRNARQPTIGCKSGTDGELLRMYCSDLCVFSDAFPTLNIGGPSGAKAKRPASQDKAVL